MIININKSTTAAVNIEAIRCRLSPATHRSDIVSESNWKCQFIGIIASFECVCVHVCVWDCVCVRECECVCACVCLRRFRSNCAIWHAAFEATVAPERSQTERLIFLAMSSRQLIWMAFVALCNWIQWKIDRNNKLVLSDFMIFPFATLSETRSNIADGWYIQLNLIKINWKWW